ncbi:MAG: C/D box methylation guide ribonucleoprotein complex aNOP56 subunit [Thermoprotei archaeon]
MRASLIVSVFGLHLFDDNGNNIVNQIFKGNPEEVAEKLLKLNEGEPIEELSQMLNMLIQNNISDLVIPNESLGKAINALSFKGSLLINRGVVRLNSVVKDLALKSGWVSTVEEYFSIKRAVTLEMSRILIRRAQSKRDQSIVQAINAIDEINKTVNNIVGRIKEWYGLYFPEINNIIRDNELYVKLVHDIVYREDYNRDRLKDLGLKPDLIDKLEKSANASVGAELADEDLEVIKKLAEEATRMYEARSELEKYVDNAMSEVAPNIKGLVGPTIGARLIALAGGLEKLAKMPSSTIQVLGAEKALFRALRFGSKPPKHGVIYQHVLVHTSPKWQRGKISRALAGKLSIAAKIDFFSGRDVSERLKKELEEKINLIKKTAAVPPIKKTEKETKTQPRIKERPQKFKGKKKR